MQNSMQKPKPKPLDQLIRKLDSQARFVSQVAEHRYLPPVAPAYAELAIHASLQEVLNKTGIQRLWSHQQEAIEAIRRGENVVVMTPTASGKTMIYNLPVLETILEEPDAKALYVFPLKGLEQDQAEDLNGWFDALNLHPERNPQERSPLQAAEIYDGDVSAYRRKKIRERFPKVVFTNPDMIHLAINPFHQKWEGFFKHLKYIVIDEIHAYRGVFGSNTAHVFRRLRRICQHYGANPQFVACSATIANPRPLAESLTGLPFTEVVESGAPQGGRHFWFVNPERSPYTEATWLFLQCLEANLRAIVFTKARKITELIYRWAVERGEEIADKISPYRAGFLPRERREIEQRLFHGELMGVVSTSALELGVDIGGLDACILVGYPGSIASTWQRAGRVGRHAEESAIFLIAIKDALDQYFMRHPEDFFGKSHEAVVVDPNNPRLLKKHLLCAAAELYLHEDDPVYDVGSLRPLIEEMVAGGDLNRGKRGDVWFTRKRRPQPEVGIRSIGDPFDIFNERGEKIGELSGARIFREAHLGAIYLHWGRQYQITQLDLLGRRALCREVDVRYYTHALSREETEILMEEKGKALACFHIHWGKLRISHQVIGYDKRGLFDGERISRHALEMPTSLFDTEGLWIPIDEATKEAIVSQDHDLGGTLHAVEHVAIKCIPLFVLGDPGDIGGLSYPSYPSFGGPAIFLYDGYEGGIGFTLRAFEVAEDWLAAILRLVSECPCKEGCPSCVQDPQCGSANEPLDKSGAIFLLRRLLGLSSPDFVPRERTVSRGPGADGL